MGAAYTYVLQEFNGGHVLTLLFQTWGAYLASVVMQSHHGDVILMLTLEVRLPL